MVGERCYVQIEVIDSGIGVPQNRLRDIFSAFSQVEDSDRRRFGGTGLGLSISRHLCRLMGGDLQVTSQVGEGSTFIATMSLLVSRHSDERPVSTRLQDWRFEGEVLVVEDNAVNQRVIRAMLERIGFVVTVVDDGSQALDVCADQTFDIIFMDMQMPVMDGIEQRSAYDRIV